jgi:hypothetical protein
MFIQVTKKINSYVRPMLLNIEQVNYMYQGTDNDTVIVFSDHTVNVTESIQDILGLI